MPKAAAVRSGVARTIADEVRAFCIEKSNPDLVRKYSKYFREGYDAYGIDSKDPAYEAHKTGWAQRLRAASPTAYLDLADLLIPCPKYEEPSFAITIAATMRNVYTPAHFARIAKWFEAGIRNWAHTDVLSGMVLANFLIDGVAGIDDLAAWCASPHKYQRRAVPVTMVSLLKHRKDYKTLLDTVEPLMNDAEREVHQGVGWFLRELWKKEPKLVERFLAKHKETAPRLIFQYATEKMTAEQKARYKRSKSARR